ncbi:MAG TPA: hypothetical protein PL158_00880, partial [Bacillota bacterium]|nr:hypothetical protein [Bacillota bacterium]
KKVAKYWRNGQAIELNEGDYDADANSIYVVGNDVYVAGYEEIGGKKVAKYWKNGQAEALSDGTNDAFATGIFVVNR